MIKPNICGFDGLKDAAKTGDDGVKGRTTDPEFVRGAPPPSAPSEQSP